MCCSSKCLWCTRCCRYMLKAVPSASWVESGNHLPKSKRPPSTCHHPSCNSTIRPCSGTVHRYSRQSCTYCRRHRVPQSSPHPSYYTRIQKLDRIATPGTDPAPYTPVQNCSPRRTPSSAFLRLHTSAQCTSRSPPRTSAYCCSADCSNSGCCWAHLRLQWPLGTPFSRLLPVCCTPQDTLGLSKTSDSYTES